MLTLWEIPRRGVVDKVLGERLLKGSSLGEATKRR